MTTPACLRQSKKEKGKRKKSEAESSMDRPEKKNDLEERLFAFSLRVIRLYQTLTKHSETGRILGRQLLRSATSIGANYQEGQGGQSRADFVSKTSIALKESRETHYWLHLVIGSDLLPKSLIADLLDESDQIKRILGAIVSRCKLNTKKPRGNGA
jgi:four helix bundle protein